MTILTMLIMTMIMIVWLVGLGKPSIKKNKKMGTRTPLFCDIGLKKGKSALMSSFSHK